MPTSQGASRSSGTFFLIYFKHINTMAVYADGRYWIHIAHPSGLNGHFNTWLHSDLGSGQKRLLAKAAAVEAQQGAAGGV